MKVIIAPTEDFNRREKTAVTANVSAGSAVVISVANTDGFLLNDFVVVGLEGSQQAELCQITNVDTSGQTITVNMLNLNHLTDEPIVKYAFNQRKFYGCTTANGTFAELTESGSPVTIMVNNPQGTPIEYSTDEGYLFFYATYYNSQTTEETDQDEGVVTSGDDTTRYCSLYAIRVQAGLTENPYISDGRIEAKRLQAENEINSVIIQIYTLPLVDTITGAPSIPALIQRIAIMLAAGYISYEEEGKDGDGVKFLGEARGLLKQLLTRQQRLLDSNYNEYALWTKTSGVQSYPNRVDNYDGPPRFFTSEQIF